MEETLKNAGNCSNTNLKLCKFNIEEEDVNIKEISIEVFEEKVAKW